MPLAFTGWDWAVIAAYVALLSLAGWWASRREIDTAEDYFLASHHAPIWLVTISVISTMQSAATFLGAPDNSFRGNYTYLTANIAAIIAAWIVATILIPRFYAIGATTVYELLEQRYSIAARRAAGAMYLVGRVLASGSRLFLASIAVSMMIFLDVEPAHIAIAALLMTIFGIVFTLVGGLNAVIWSDLVQVVLYVGAAILVLFFLLAKIPAGPAEIIDALRHTPGGIDKLKMFDWSADLSQPFTMLAILTGLVLLNVGNAGLDQDTTQRFLSCEDARAGRRALYASALAGIPVIALFLVIGSLLYIFYERPDIMLGAAGGAMSGSFSGEKITVFMAFILSEIPPGLRGLVTVGVLAAAAINSGLISMSAVLVSDFYRPWAQRRAKKRGTNINPHHYVSAGRGAVILLALALFAMAVLCYYWQQSTDMPLLEFVLSVMVFAYSGLIGVFAVAVFTSRGNTASVIAGLLAGFVTTILMQPLVAQTIGLPAPLNNLAFPFQLCIGSAIAFIVTALPRGSDISRAGNAPAAP